MSKSQIPLARAEAIANKIIDAIKPHCERIAVAGSIRRRCGTVGDIDIVAWPRDRAAIKEALDGRCIIKTNGESITTLLLRDGSTHAEIYWSRGHDSSTADLFNAVTYPPNWGSVLLSRTGSKWHNIRLAEHARKLGLLWSVTNGVFCGVECIASETEEEIFAALKLDFVPPEERQ